MAVRPPGSNVHDDLAVEFVVGEKRPVGSGKARAGQKLANPHGKQGAPAEDLS